MASGYTSKNSITSRVLFNSQLMDRMTNTLLEASYDPVGGCKGALKYVRVAPTRTDGSGTSTGVYYVNVKNIVSSGFGFTSSINDGATTFDYNTVTFFSSRVVSTNPIVAGSSDLHTMASPDYPNGQINVYVFNSSGLVNLPVGNRIIVNISFRNLVLDGRFSF